MNTVAIVQARMGSTRLPGKALVEICGEPMLARVMMRSERAKSLRQVIVATTIGLADDAISALCAVRGWSCFRGDENDVLDRYYQAAQRFAADTVVRITSDCPLIDPDVIDLTVNEYLRLQPNCDYVSNAEPPRPYPRGLDVEVLSFRTLAQAWREARDPAFREHVTLYVYRHPNKFRCVSLLADRDCSSQRWTVDTFEDLALVRTLYEYFGHDRFGWRDVLAALIENPEWAEFNRHVRQKVV